MKIVSNMSLLLDGGNCFKLDLQLIIALHVFCAAVTVLFASQSCLEFTVLFCSLLMSQRP